MRSHVIRWPPMPANPRRCAPASAYQSMPVQGATLWVARRPTMRGMFGWPLGTPRVQEAHCCGPLERESKTHSPPFNYVELSLVPVGRREGGRAQAGARGVGRRTDEHVMDWLTEVEKSALPPHFLMSSIPRGALHLQRN